MNTKKTSLLPILGILLFSTHIGLLFFNYRYMFATTSLQKSVPHFIGSLIYIMLWGLFIGFALNNEKLKTLNFISVYSAIFAMLSAFIMVLSKMDLLGESFFLNIVFLFWTVLLLPFSGLDFLTGVHTILLVTVISLLTAGFCFIQSRKREISSLQMHLS